MSGAPIIKWAGGKTRLLRELVERTPMRFGRYYEPFAGGAALFFRLAPEQAILGDTNVDLVVMYGAVAHDVDGVISLLKQHAGEHALRGAEYYYLVRELWNNVKGWTPTQRAAAFIYLNKTCFNGLWRVNAAGRFNVPAGKYQAPSICNEVGLRAASLVLRNCVGRAGHYKSVVADAKAGDFVYFDPPYDGTFTDYAAGGFGDADQQELAETARMLVARGVQVMLSNSDTPFVRALYYDFAVDVVKCGRAIAADGERRKAVDELVMFAGYTPARKIVGEVQGLAQFRG